MMCTYHNSVAIIVCHIYQYAVDNQVYVYLMYFFQTYNKKNVILSKFTYVFLLIKNT